MQRLPNVYPADTVAWPNKEGTFDIGAADAGSKILMRNLTPLNLRLDFYNGSTDTLSAWEHNYWVLDGDTPTIGWSIDPDSPNVVSPPSNVVYMTLFSASEKIPGTYPVFSVLQSSVGNPGGISTTVPSNVFYNVKDAAYGAVGDGISDDSVAIAAARSAANAAGGGTVYYPHGTYITGNLVDYDNVVDGGDGTEVTTLRLKAGSNTDLFGSRYTSSINLSAALGSGPSAASKNWEIRDMTLDGNAANQASGPSYCIRAYAYGYRLRNVHCINGFSGGAQVDYYGPFPSTTGVYEFQWENTRFLFNRGIGAQIGGPTDSQWINGYSAFNTVHNVHITPHASQILCANVHAYTPELVGGGISTTGLSWLIEGGAQLVNCIGETSGVGQVAIITSSTVKWAGGSVFGGGYNGFGFQIGQMNGNAPYSGQINQSAGLTTLVRANNYIIQGVSLSSIANAAGAIWFANDGGGLIDVSYQPNVGVPLTTGTQHVKTSVRHQEIGTTPNGTFANDGGLLIGSGILNMLTGGKYSFHINDAEQMSIDTGSVRAQVPFKGPNAGTMVIDSANANPISLRYNGVEQAQIPNNGIALKNGSLSLLAGGVARMGKGYVASLTATVTHGLGVTPDIVIITPDIAQPGSATVGVGNLTSTTFDAHIGAGNGFYWLAMQG